MPLNPNALTSVAYVQALAPALTATSVIEDAINAFSQAAESHCGRVFRSVQVVTGSPSGNNQAALEYYQGNGKNELQLRRYPITAVERIRINETALASTDYTFIPQLADDGILYRLNGWPLQCGTFPDLTLDPDVSARAYNIDIAYTGGYATIPTDLQQACAREVVRVLSNPNPGLSSEKTPGGWEQKWADIRWGAQGFGTPYLPETLVVLNRYKARWF